MTEVGSLTSGEEQGLCDLGWEFLQTGPEEWQWLRFNRRGETVARQGDATWARDVASVRALRDTNPRFHMRTGEGYTETGDAADMGSAPGGPDGPGGEHRGGGGQHGGDGAANGDAERRPTSIERWAEHDGATATSGDHTDDVVTS